MHKLFRIDVDERELTDEVFAFVTDPSAARNDRPVVSELHDLNPDIVEVLESFVLDGVDQRHYVADYVHAVIGQMTA